MRIFFYFGHPAQFHFYKNIIRELKNKGNEIFLFIKSKDVLETLVKETGWNYSNIQPQIRGRSKWATFFSLLKRDFFISLKIITLKPDLLIASDPSFSHAGFLFRIPSLNFIDDDYDAAGEYANVTYPFTSTIITPDTVKVGRWEHKRISYKGYMKLAYLHPNWFTPDMIKTGMLESKNYYLIRLSGLSAHHDTDKKGINPDFLKTIIQKLSESGRVIISSEGNIASEFDKYKMELPVSDIHHFLYYSKALISDSQSMSGEAAMLGIPSIRISSFKGKLSVLEELENKYGLTFAFRPDEENAILLKINELVEIPDVTEIFQQRRQKMLDDKIDVTSFCVWFIENYPESKHIMQQDPAYADTFR